MLGWWMRSLTQQIGSESLKAVPLNTHSQAFLNPITDRSPLYRWILRLASMAQNDGIKNKTLVTLIWPMSYYVNHRVSFDIRLTPTLKWSILNVDTSIIVSAILVSLTKWAEGCILRRKIRKEKWKSNHKKPNTADNRFVSGKLVRAER